MNLQVNYSKTIIQINKISKNNKITHNNKILHLNKNKKNYRINNLFNKKTLNICVSVVNEIHQKFKIAIESSLVKILFVKIVE